MTSQRAVSHRIAPHRAASHQGKGWERFTDAIIRLVNDREEPVVFILWGSYAQRKASFVDTTKHCVIKSPHPSPLSARRGFFGGQDDLPLSISGLGDHLLRNRGTPFTTLASLLVPRLFIV